MNEQSQYDPEMASAWQAQRFALKGITISLELSRKMLEDDPTGPDAQALSEHITYMEDYMRRIRMAKTMAELRRVVFAHVEEMKKKNWSDLYTA